MKKFKLKNGGCTVYAFICGYGDVITNNDFEYSHQVLVSQRHA